jgi:hypothetical protein
VFSRIRAAMARAEDHWLTDLVGVCILFAIPPAMLFAGAILEGQP